MGFIKEKYTNNQAGLVVSFQGEENTESYIDTDSVAEAMSYFHLYLKDNRLYTESDDAIVIEKIGIAVEEASELRSLMDEYAVAGTVYKIGDQAIFEGVVYKSKVDNNSWSPADYPDGWELVG